MKLVFATHNEHKITEVSQIIGASYNILSLTDINFNEYIEETGTTFAQNALIKAQTVADKTGYAVFADDSGLEVGALQGAPGIYSARYAGLPVNHTNNNALLLQKLDGIKQRQARFKTVVVLVYKNQTHYFEGIIEGNIALQLMGEGGFGYDPLFIPDGYDKSFAQLSLDEKNNISHRGKAIQKLIEFLKIWNPE
jgi:XTP/dITP diphosphohydrolase